MHGTGNMLDVKNGEMKVAEVTAIAKGAQIPYIFAHNGQGLRYVRDVARATHIIDVCF
jgi:hypothetical protein